TNGVLQVKGSSVCFAKMVNGKTNSLDDWFNTGDIVTEHPDRSLTILGRTGDIVIGDSGENIHPDTLEPAFDVCRKFSYTILGLPGEQGEELALIVQIPSYLTAKRREHLLSQLQEANRVLSPTTRVAKFYATSDPLMAATAIKISRAYVKRGIQNGQIHLESLLQTNRVLEDNADSSPLLTTVTEIAAQVLNRETSELLPDAHLMDDLGVSSLQYFALLSALADEFSLSSDQNEQYVYTLREFSAYIERHMEE
ncbi:MAG: hypothetical protein IKU10_05520, partial [Clostridia bacterium]|nr:hypothetical protein [Clostridia bacterium]